MVRVAMRTGISPAELLDTPMPILAAIVGHLTGNHDVGRYDIALEDVAVTR